MKIVRDKVRSGGVMVTKICDTIRLLIRPTTKEWKQNVPSSINKLDAAVSEIIK